MSAGPLRFKKKGQGGGILLRRGVIRTAILALAMAVAGAPPCSPAAPPAMQRGGTRDPNAPGTAAEKIAGRWRLTLDGLSVDHQEILASLAVDGGLLIGTLTVGQSTVKISSGEVFGADFSFSFRHLDGGSFKMSGSATERGLQGVWEARNERGKWRASRLR
jgi:hypothetical protein